MNKYILYIILIGFIIYDFFFNDSATDCVFAIASSYLICGQSETCCDSPGVGGICCNVCQNCTGGACIDKDEGSICGTGKFCCGDPNQCIDILSDESNCGGCGVFCGGTCINGSCV